MTWYKPLILTHYYPGYERGRILRILPGRRESKEKDKCPTVRENEQSSFCVHVCVPNRSSLTLCTAAHIHKPSHFSSHAFPIFFLQYRQHHHHPHLPCRHLLLA